MFVFCFFGFFLLKHFTVFRISKKPNFARWLPDETRYLVLQNNFMLIQLYIDATSRSAYPNTHTTKPL